MFLENKCIKESRIVKGKCCIGTVRDKFGEEYEVWEITKDEFEQRLKPNINYSEELID